MAEDASKEAAVQADGSASTCQEATPAGSGHRACTCTDSAEAGMESEEESEEEKAIGEAMGGA